MAAIGYLKLAAIPKAPVTHVDVHDGFETRQLSGIWDSHQLEPGSVVMQSEVVRAGRSAARVVVHTRDRFEAGIHGSNDTERDELCEAWHLISRQDTTYEYAFSVFFPADFPIVPTRLVVAQWKQTCPGGACVDDDVPVVAIRYSAGQLRIVQNLESRQRTLFRTGEEVRGRWLDFRFQMRFSTTDQGLIRAWIGERQVVDYHGVNANQPDRRTGYQSPSRFYFHMGLYRDVMEAPMTIFIDEYRKRELRDGG